MRPMIQKKSEEQLRARAFRSLRKAIAKRIARKVSRPVTWVNGRLVDPNGKLVSGHPVPKPKAV